jgi:hypothetical protein
MNPFLDSGFRWFAVLGLVLAAWFVVGTKSAVQKVLGASEEAMNERHKTYWVIRGPAIVVLGSLLYLLCQALYASW